MSRDMTPAETLLFEQYNKTNGGQDMWSFMEGLKISTDGETYTDVYTKEEISIRKEYGNFGKLYEGFKSLYEEMKKFPTGLAVLRQAADELETYINEKQGDESSYVLKWFSGKLDSNVQWNTKLLSEYLLNRAKETSLLAKFKVNDETYAIYGTYSLTRCGMEFSDVTAKIIINDEEQDYIPDGENWFGEKYDAEDMITSVIHHLILSDNQVESIYLENGIQEFVSGYTADTVEVELEGNKKHFPRKVLSNDLLEELELELVTNQYAYYVYDNSVLMISVKTMKTVADNYFAEVGYCDSVEDVRTGKENLLWGTLPEE